MTQPSEAKVIALKRGAWIFAAPTILGIAALFVLVAYRQGVLTSKDRINFLTNTALGITTGMPVKLNGFVIGAVDQIVLLQPSVQSDQRVRVELGIYRDYMDYIPKTTIARLLQEGLIGQSVIELLPLRYDARPVASGEVLEFERSKGLSEIAAQLQDRIIPVLQNAQTLEAGLNDPNGPFQQSLVATHALLKELPQTNLQVQRTLVQASASISSMEKHVNATLGTVDRSVQTVNQALPGLLKKADQTVDNLQQASGDIREITRQSVSAAPIIIDEAQDLASNGNKVVQGAMRTWPISAVVEPAAARSVPLDSQQGLPPIKIDPK